ncbi:MAG TPA: RimK/LysX family protein [Aestuariivirga sp.]|nr:RimK/LysX family protein [Aestuariivirga sp.]
MRKPKRKRYVAPITIGWRERVSLPDLGIDFVAKMDTGAEYCALHATKIKRQGEFISFQFEPGETLQAPRDRRKTIKHSDGRTKRRFVINTRVKIGTKLIDATVTLIDRSKMKHKMLLGRRSLRGHFIIDPKRRFTLSKKKKPLVK